MSKLLSLPKQSSHTKRYTSGAGSNANHERNRHLMRQLVTFDHQDSPPLIVTASQIRTVDDDRSVAEAMLIHGGTILAVGSLAEVEQAAAEASLKPQLADFEGATIVPGFVDAHAHPLMYGQLLTWVDISPQRATTIPEIIELLQQAEKTLPPGMPLRGFGYEQGNLGEQRHPTRFELDQVATDREVYIMNASGHGGVVNS